MKTQILSAVTISFLFGVDAIKTLAMDRTVGIKFTCPTEEEILSHKPIDLGENTNYRFESNGIKYSARLYDKGSIFFGPSEKIFVSESRGYVFEIDCLHEGSAVKVNLLDSNIDPYAVSFNKSNAFHQRTDKQGMNIFELPINTEFTIKLKN